MIDAKITVEKLIAYAKEFLHLNDFDEIYARNLLLRELGLTSPYLGKEDLDLNYIKELSVPDVLLDELCAYAMEKGFITEDEKERYSAHIMGILTPLPSEVNRVFKLLRESIGPQEACDYLYQLSMEKMRKHLADRLG